jgi:hypothetical protein
MIKHHFGMPKINFVMPQIILCAKVDLSVVFSFDSAYKTFCDGEIHSFMHTYHSIMQKSDFILHPQHFIMSTFVIWCLNIIL